MKGKKKTPVVQGTARRIPNAVPEQQSVGMPRRTLWVVLGLALLVVAIYSPVRNYNFVSFDDPAYVTENSHVQAGITGRGAIWALTSGEASNWHPLTWLSHMLDVQVSGMNAGPQHITSVLFHIANSCLLFAWLLSMTRAIGRSAFVAGLFAVHPLHVESVAWIAERKDVLSTLFGLLTLWAYVAYVRRPERSRYVLVMLLFLLGLMAKPMLVTLPLLMVLLDWWPLRRITLPIFTIKQRPLLRQLLLEKVPFLALSVASSLVTIVVQQRGGSVQSLESIPFQDRVLNSLVSYAGYLTKMMWPDRLAVFYPFPSVIPIWKPAVSALMLAAVTIFVCRVASQHPYFVTGWFWYLGSLVPVIGLVQVGNQSMADRYTYIPLVGIFVMMAWGIPELLKGTSFIHTALPYLALLTIVILSVVARNQLQYWKGNVVLWDHTLRVTDDNYVANVHMGNAVLAEGRADDAIAHYAEALRVRPNYDSALDNMGIVLLNQGRFREALPYLTKAVQVNPSFGHAQNDLGVAMERDGHIDDAIVHYSEAVRLEPALEVAHVNLAKLFATQGRVDQAIGEYQEAARLNPSDPIPHYDLGIVFNSKGDTARAIGELRNAVRLKPDYPEAKRALSILSKSTSPQ